LTGELLGGQKSISVSWRNEEKVQPKDTAFKVPAVDAPNVNGARMFGLVSGTVGDPVADADLSSLRQAVEAGRINALYVFDPGPDGSLGDVDWIADARARGVLSLLIVQGVLMTKLAQAADVVLPGASYVEKEASYTNGQGTLQGTARAINPPGDAQEDWQILVNVGRALGVPFAYTTSAEIRADAATRFAGVQGLQGLPALTFNVPLEARNWLQASNPSERWKWDFMYQDLPPVKGSLDPSSLPMPPGAIPLRKL
jgi:anaerobic selenocysteine-containing dehydrogenase